MKGWRTPLAVWLVASLIVAATIAHHAFGKPERATAQTSAGAGAQTLTDIRVRGLDGASVSLLSYRRKPLWLNFFATWCPPCNSEMPEIERHYRFRGLGVSERMSSEQYHSKLPKQDISSGDKRISDVLTQAKQQVGMVPNMYAFMSNAPELLETYLVGYDKFRKDSGFTSVEQEVVFLTISFENACDYCMAAHSTIANGPSKVPKDVTDAIRANAPIADPKLAALSKLTRTLFVTRGRPSNDDVQEFLRAGYSEKHVLDIILALAVKTLSNYSNHVFATPVDPMFAQREWKSLAHSH